MDCIDLETRFGRRYRVGYEDPQFAATQDPWHKIVKCKSGHICPSGETTLWACTKGRRSRVAKAMLSGELPCVIKMDGDDGINAEFDVSDFQSMFSAMGAIRR